MQDPSRAELRAEAMAQADGAAGMIPEPYESDGISLQEQQILALYAIDQRLRALVLLLESVADGFAAVAKKGKRF